MDSIQLEVNGLNIACKTWGNHEHPSVIAIHGWLDNANSFDPVAQYLQNSYYIIAIDLPGHGYSAHLPMSSNYHFIDAVLMVMHVIDALKLEKVHLLGHSLGACIASIVAGIAPSRFISLGLIEGLGPFSKPEEAAEQQLSQYIPLWNANKIKRPKCYSSFEQAVLARSIKGYVSMDIANILCDRGVIKKQKGYYWRHDRRLLIPSPLFMTEQQVMSCLKQITAPSYLFWASNGLSFNLERMQKRIQAIRNLQIERLDGGHHIHMEQPEKVARLLTAFYQLLR